MEQQKQSSALQNAELQIIGKNKAKKLGIKYYFTGIPCANNHISKRYVNSGHCFQCKYENSKKLSKFRVDYFKEYYSSNEYKERKKILSKKPKNKKQKRVREKERYHENKDKARKKARQKYHAMSDDQKRKMYLRRKELRDMNPCMRIKDAARAMVNRCMRLTGRKKTTRTEIILGYSSDDLMKRMESMLASDLCINDYGKTWEIDHIIPLSYCIKKGIYDLSVINQLDNLQPLRIEENRSKSDNVPSGVFINGINK